MAGSREWRAWLEKNHAGSNGIFLVLAKKGTTKPTSLTYAEALEEALCFGWIDGQARSRDEGTFMQGFTPRRNRSPWSRRNTGIAERLVVEGRMHASGIAEMERARADGRWEAAYAGPATIEVPAELAAALAASPKAKSMFDALNSQNRYAILYRIATAKRAETQTRRTRQFVEMLERGETIYPQKRGLEEVAVSPRRGKR
ncbi:MAG TPA: YdeI/OmpD-associated family protein [Candidatus Dormibacteraeota bacterium]|nr:YdeI/OmpD-associated family protein [Candidatus Dormibacteraeota bacterium]